MSFFRVLLALLISGGIAYGLYRVVDDRSAERAVEAVRSEIEEPEGEAAETETAVLTTPNALTESPADTDEGEGTETAGEAEENETSVAATEADSPVASTEGEQSIVTAEAEPSADSADTEKPAASTEDEQSSESDEVATAPDPVAEQPDPTDEGESAEASGDTQTAAVATGSEAASGTESVSNDWATRVENSTGSASEPEVSPEAEADPTDEGESAETVTAALPAVSLAAATSDSVDALKIVTGGMTYREALATLTDAGWKPRTETGRATDDGEPNAAEVVLLEAGYAELEGCKGDDRPICRFEFMDGEKRIAAVITAGTGIDPGVIDAFLMDIAAE